MHEYLLYSQIPTARHTQVLQIMAGLTAAQPVDFSEQHLVYQQIKASEPTASKKGQVTQSIRSAQLSYHKLVRDIADGENLGPWKLRKEEQPQAGLKDVISRAVVDYVAPDTDFNRFKPEEGCFKLVTQFLLTGCHFVQGNVVIRIMRTYIPTERSLGIPTSELPPVGDETKALDESGAYIVEASIRTTDESSSDVRDKAKAELLTFARSVEGAIDFHAPDRLVLDTRVRGT